jgi:hypothetical protein
LLQHEFRERFPDAQVFMGLDSIEPGQDFSEVIQQAVGSCAVLVVLIGRRRATITDEEGSGGWITRTTMCDSSQHGAGARCAGDSGAGRRGQTASPAGVACLPSKLARLDVLDLSMERYQYDAERLRSHLS